MKVVVNYFGATWCIPCRTLKPTLARTIKHLRSHGAEVEYNVIDIDEQPSKAREYGVLSVPLITIGRRNGMAYVEQMLTGGMATAANAREAIRRLAEL